MGASTLAQVLRPLADVLDSQQIPDLLVGLDVSDDAAVYRLNAAQAIVVTTDFFPPIVDDPQVYGAIAAANAMSDVYAMGGDVVLALNLAGFPSDMHPATMSAITRGGAQKVREAGGVVAGGHTVIDAEPKYGLAVVGLVEPGRVLTKRGARPGDRLVLTKPIGTGVVTTALKNGQAGDEDVAAAVESMLQLNRGAAHAALAARAHAVTDVSGFGLIGHACEVAERSGVSVRLEASRVPLLPGAVEYARAGHVPGGTQRNIEAYEPAVGWRAEPPPEMRALMHDPQTSGGLLISVPEDRLTVLLDALEAHATPGHVVGESLPKAELRVECV
jgi:selenide,water dikinase